jgi:predicted DsbA family dithiol-disulfide isomerase
MKQKIKIDIVSDVVCPWCYIGKRRLEKALDRLSAEFDFEIQYHPFELNPQMPAQGEEQKSYLTKKFGSAERYQELTSRVIYVAGRDGLTMDYEAQKVSPNTRKLHALIKFAGSKGLQLPLVEALFNAYFTAGVDLSKDENVVAVASKAGLNEKDVASVLENKEYLLQTAHAEQEIYRLGITGVPFYIINNKYGISGAQASETFERALRDIGNESVLQGESCDTDSVNC